MDTFSELKKDDLCPTTALGLVFDRLWWLSIMPLIITIGLSLLFRFPNPFADWVFIVFSILLGIEWRLFYNMLEAVPRDLNLVAASGRLKRRRTSKYEAFDIELRNRIRQGIFPEPEPEQGTWSPQIRFWQIATVAGILLMIIYTFSFNDIYHWTDQLTTGANGKCVPPHLIIGAVGILSKWPIFDVARCAFQNFLAGWVGGPIPLLWSVPIGAGIWVVVAIGRCLSKLTKIFEFDLIPGHPDGSGGLGKLGNICFRLGLLSVLPQLVTLGIFIYGLSAKTDLIVVLMAGFVSFTFLILAIPSFMLPLWHIHQEMKVQRDKYEMNLTRKIVDAEQELREYFKPASPDAPTLETAQKKIEALQKLTPKARDFPIWPFSRRITLVIGPNIIVPLITFILPTLSPQYKDLIATLVNSIK